MVIQAIPLFNSGKVLRQKMLTSLSDYTYQHGILHYQGCADGIVCGCSLTTTDDSIIVNPGIVRYEGELYLIKEAIMHAYFPTNSTRVLQLHFHDKVTTESFIMREIELCFTDEDSRDRRHMELCRFKLQPGARLRYEYTNFADRETEYDTLNTLHSPFSGWKGSTLSPDITRHFANEALAAGASGMDASFCLQILAQRGPVQGEALRAYIKMKLGSSVSCETNLQMYHGLLTCMNQLEKSELTTTTSRKPWKIVVD